MSEAGPTENPVGWDSVLFTDVNDAYITMPPREGVGHVVVSVPSAQKLDAKKKAGARGATVTKQASDAAELVITYRFNARNFREVIAGIDAIDPRGPSKGGPFRIQCPNLPAGLEYVTVGEVSPRGTAMVKRGVGECTIKCIETTFNRGNGGTGGAVTAGLSEFDRASKLLAIKILQQRLATTNQIMQNAATQEERDEAIADLVSIQEQIAKQQRELDEGSASPFEASDTVTPTKAGQAPPGAGTLSGKLSDLDQGSYDTSKNKDAPKGTP
jgi:hypothetical protein